MNITITGNLGSGKTSVCKELEKRGFTIISAGSIFRDIANEKGMTVTELNEAAKTDRSIDDLLDNRSTELGKTMDNTVFDSRLAWNFVEHSFKVFLLVDTQEAADRVFLGGGRSAETYRDVQEARAGLEARARLEQERFSDLYGIDYYNAANYDLVIESSQAAPDQIAQEIQRNFELYQKKPFPTKVELNLACLYPTEPFASIKTDELEADIRKEKEEGQTLCSTYTPSIVIKNGFDHITEGHRQVLAAIAAGKVFVEIRDIRMGGDGYDAIKPLPEGDIRNYENAGNFRYKADPAMIEERAGYMIDFSQVFP